MGDPRSPTRCPTKVTCTPYAVLLKYRSHIDRPGTQPTHPTRRRICSTLPTPRTPLPRSPATPDPALGRMLPSRHSLLPGILPNPQAAHLTLHPTLPTPRTARRRNVYTTHCSAGDSTPLEYPGHCCTFCSPWDTSTPDPALRETPPTKTKLYPSAVCFARRPAGYGVLPTRHCCADTATPARRTGAPGSLPTALTALANTPPPLQASAASFRPHAPPSGAPHTAPLGSTSHSASPLLGGSALGTHCATGVLCAPRTAPPDSLLPVSLYAASSPRDSAALGTRRQMHVH